MPKTKAECRNRALTMLGKLPLGHTPSGALANDMEAAYDQVYAKLKQYGLVTWGPNDSVPDEFVEDITALMAMERSEGIPESRFARIVSAANNAPLNISALIAGTYNEDLEYTDF